MPRLNGTGPAGMGSMTGRGLGPCGGGYGRGRGRGRGQGFGYGMMMGVCPWYGQMAKPTAQEEKEILKDQIGLMKENLQAAEKRLSEIESQK